MDQNQLTSPGKSTWLWVVLIIVILAAIGFFGWKYWEKSIIKPSTTPSVVSAPEVSNQQASISVATPLQEQKNNTPICNVDTKCGDKCFYNGEEYPTKLLSGSCWLTKNLNTIVKADGTTPSNRYCYNDDTNICKTDGGLYSWADAYGLSESCNTIPCNVAKNQQGICPSDWHVVTEPEWVALTNKYSYDDLITGGAANFNAVLVGYRNAYNGGIYDYRGLSGHYWSSTNFDTLQVWYRSFYADSEERTIYRSKNPKTGGAAVRCIKN
jgi:uncharacterized protein (TIGR02145 family)